jgi:hypothetical protein
MATLSACVLVVVLVISSSIFQTSAGGLSKRDATVMPQIPIHPLPIPKTALSLQRVLNKNAAQTGPPEAPFPVDDACLRCFHP